MDIYIIAHFFGWAAKTLLFRNNILVWIMSIGFEVLELSLKQFFPNFHECWWDSLLLDLFGCNLLGIIIGNYIIKKLQMRRFHWLKEPGEGESQKTLPERVVYQFSSVDEYIRTNKWHFLATPLNLLTILWIVAANFILDLSNFFNKAVLNIPSDHWILISRVILLFFIGFLAQMELYNYIMTKHSEKKLSQGIVIGHLIILFECLLFINNFPPNFFNKPTSLMTKAFWLLVSGIVALMLFYTNFN